MLIRLSVFILLLSTNCEVHYRFLGVTNGSTIWIVEDVDGECGYTDLRQVDFSDSTKARSIQTYFKEDTTGFSKGFDLLEKDKVKKLSVVNGKCTVTASLSFSLPANRNDLLAKAEERYHKDYQMKSQPGDSTMVEPVFQNGPPKFLYAADGGLYVNYTFSDIYYAPDSGLLIIFTHNDNKFTTDALHGFLVYRLPKSLR